MSNPRPDTPSPTTYTSLTEYCKTLATWTEQQRSLISAFYYREQMQASALQAVQLYANQYALQYHTAEKRRLGCGSGTEPEVPPPATGASTRASTVNQQLVQQISMVRARQAAAVVQDPNMPIQGRRYLIPNPWKRVAAEIIDYLLLLLFKILLALLINRDLSLRQIAENIDLDLRYLSHKSATLATAGGDSTFGEGTLGDQGRTSPSDMNPFDLLNPEIILAELLNRVLVTCFETVCLSRGFRGVMGGCTPGKKIMGLRVVSCTEVYDLPGRVEVLPGVNPGIVSALIRSVIKNFAMVFFFPICLTTLFFQHHRATYDIIAGTVVVQEEPRRPAVEPPRP